MLEPEEHGVYLLLMFEYYSTGKPIPDDRFAISKICRIPPQKAQKNLEKIARFFERKDGFLYHDKIERELAKSLELHEKLSKAGKKGGKKSQAQAQARPQPQPQPHKDNKHICNIPENQDAENSTPEQVKNKPKRTTIPYQQIIDLYHELLPELPRCEVITTKRKGQIGARHRDLDGSLKKWSNFFKYIRLSDFLMGKTPPSQGHKQFKANIEWVTNESNFAKISEEQYHDA